MAGNSGPPTRALEAAQRNIQELGTDPEMAQALEIYGADVDDLAKGIGTAALRPVGWRWLVPTEDRWTAVDIYLDEGGEPLGRPQRQRGGLVDDLAHVLEENADARGAGSEYFRRLLEIPELNFASVWLANGESDDSGVLITLSPLAAINPHERLNLRTLNPLLRDMARYQIDVDVDEAGGYGGLHGSGGGSSSIAWEKRFVDYAHRLLRAFGQSKSTKETSSDDPSTRVRY